MKGLIRKPATAESPRCAGATAGAALGIRRLGVTLTRGTGRITSSVVSGIEGRQIGHRDLAVATGSRPAVPPVKGLDKVAAWTSDQGLSAPTPPASLMVSGGGLPAVNLLRRMPDLAWQ